MNYLLDLMACVSGPKRVSQTSRAHLLIVKTLTECRYCATMVAHLFLQQRSSQSATMTTTTTSHRTCLHVKDSRQDAWLFRQFQKDRLRARERYWESLPRAVSRTRERFEFLDAHHDVIIADGLVWRKYLRLISHLIEAIPDLKFLLLESAVELMDWRNSSPCIQQVDDNGASYLTYEAAGVQERTRLQKMVLNSTIIPFCDLSAREDEDDEWNLFGYANMATVDRSRFALLRAGRIFNDIASDRVLVLVDDNDLSRFQMHSSEGVRIVSIGEFVSMLAERGSISDDDVSSFKELQNNCEDEYRRRNTRKQLSGDPTESILLSEDDIRQGLAQGTLYRGRLEVTKENPREAYVKIPDKGRFFVCKDHFSRALHHDSVVIQPLDESQWGRPVGRRRLVHQRTEEDDDDDLQANQYSDIPPVPSAKVVGIMTPSRRTYVATMIDQPLADETNVLVIPMDVRIPKIRLNTRSWQNLFQKRLLVQVEDWEEGSNYPKGRIVKILGPVGDLEVEIASLLHENEVELDPFSPAALACLPVTGPDWKIPLEEVRLRRDLRESRRIFSVDPPGCQDIDDTMHAQGRWVKIIGSTRFSF